MNKSSRVSYELFINCRKINNNLAKYVHERESFKLKLNDYPSWFKKQGIVTFWLETYKIVSKNFVENAVQLEDAKEINEHNPKSNTSTLKSEQLITVTKVYTI